MWAGNRAAGRILGAKAHLGKTHTLLLKVLGPAALALPGSLLIMHDLRPHLDLPSQNLHFITTFDYVKCVWSVILSQWDDGKQVDHAGAHFLQSLLFQNLRVQENPRWLPGICLHHFPCSSWARLAPSKSQRPCLYL
uniref:Uncharacterized protein n=1 Tax=Molossus molossus TaxID=27622 RepID=A0A7J8HIT5_MOLMO|nr:hypothetical protein HJG59_010969 [Molossus molossus]